MQLTVAVVIITSGRKELEKCVNSVRCQTYPCSVYIFTDAILSRSEYNAMADKYSSCHVSYWATKIGGKDLEGRRLIAAAPHLINEDITMFLMDDDWYKPNHVENAVKIIEQGHDWTFSFRSIYDKEGNYLFDDNCESLGEYSDCWNTPGERFAETSSVAMKTPAYRNLANVYNIKGFGVDRHFYKLAKQMYPNVKGTGKHTMCFRLGGNEMSVQQDFFVAGNAEMLRRHNGNLPWVNYEI